MKYIHQLQILFNYFYFSFNTKLFTLKLGRVGLFNCLFQKKNIQDRITNFDVSVSQLHTLIRQG